METIKKPSTEKNIESSPDIDPDLEEIKNQAQEKIDQLLQSNEYTPIQKQEMVEQKLTEINARITSSYDDEKNNLQDYRETYLQSKDTPLAQQYNDEWLAKNTDEIRHRFSQWRREDRIKKQLLLVAQGQFSDETQNIQEVIEEPIVPDDQTTEINPPQEATEPEEEILPTEEPEKSDLPPQQEQKENSKTPEINNIIKKHQELADEMRLIAGRIKSEIDNTSPREVWYQHLSRFRDGPLYAVRSQIQKIMNNVDDLNRTKTLFENNSPNAENVLQENLDQLDRDWQLLQKQIEDSSDSINRLRRRTEELLHSPLDRDNPIMRIGYQLRRATEEYDSQIHSLQ